MASPQILQRSSSYFDFSRPDPPVIRRQMSTRSELSEQLERVVLLTRSRENDIACFLPQNRCSWGGNSSQFLCFGNDSESKTATKSETRDNVNDQRRGDEVDGAHSGVVKEEARHGEAAEHKCEDRLVDAHAKANQTNHRDVAVAHGAEDNSHGHDRLHLGFSKLMKDALKGLKQQIHDIRYDVADGYTDIIQSFVAKVAHLEQPHSASEVDGFGVHLPSHYDKGDPIRLGAHLLRTEKGYQLTRVFPDTLAHKVGLRERDILTRLNDVKLEKEDEGGVLRHFMAVKKTFTLTILREVGKGEDARLVEITLHVSITLDVVERTFVLEVIVSGSQVFYIQSTDPLFITQDPFMSGQLYLNALPDNTVTMGTHSDTRAIFKLDLYAPVPQSGQLCVIRHVSSGQAYDVVEGQMKQMPDKNNVDVACLLNKRSNNDGSYVLESVARQGYYLDSSSENLELKYHEKNSVPSTARFKFYEC